MLHKTNFTRALLISALTFSAAPAFADSLDNNHVVRDARGNPVYSRLSGSCVHTMWEAGKNPCVAIAPEVAQKVAQPAPKPYVKTVLSNTEKTIYFDFNSSELTDESRNKLNNVATTLKGASDVKSAVIIGYADRKGSVSYNQSLSKRRAEAVKSYLNEKGYLNTYVADVRAVGESKSNTPCSSNLSRAEEIQCLSPDRRVEVEIDYTTEKLVNAE